MSCRWTCSGLGFQTCLFQFYSFNVDPQSVSLSGPLMVASTYHIFPHGPVSLQSVSTAWGAPHTRVLTVEQIVFVGFQGTGRGWREGSSCPVARRAALTPACPLCGLAAVISSPLSPRAQNSSLQSTDTVRSRTRGWAGGLLGAEQSALGLLAWLCLPRQPQAFYREAALGEPRESVHRPHLTAACGPFAEVA